MITVLSIAGSDPSGGAGIQLDLKAFQSLGAFGMAVPAALTVQNSRGVAGVTPVPTRALSAQLDNLLSDLRPDAVKTGMLLTRKNVDAAAAALGAYSIRNLVVDPIVRSTPAHCCSNQLPLPRSKRRCSRLPASSPRTSRKPRRLRVSPSGTGRTWIMPRGSSWTSAPVTC